MDYGRVRWARRLKEGGDQVEAARAFYDRVSRVYDALADASEHRGRERGLQLLAPAQGERILEVGFGNAAVEDRVGLRVSAAPPLPWPDSQFDAVTMSFTRELFPDGVIAEILAETRRVLRPGGRLGIVSMAVSPQGPGLGDGSASALREGAVVLLDEGAPAFRDLL